MIRVGVLTSSRADYGIYLPLLKTLQGDKDIELKIIVFGTHLSKLHGYTFKNIEADGFKAYHKIESLMLGDTPNAIATGYSLTALKFTEFWEENRNEFDIIFALGDRFEMAAAVAASIPYQLKIAHIHGGETTLGAIDNVYRHSISLSSVLHFVSADIFKDRLIQLLNDEKAKVFNVGSLSLENLVTVPILSTREFKEKWGIDLNIRSILVTVNPETVSFEQNQNYCNEISNALIELSSKYQIIITMPNVDTGGMIFRLAFEALSKNHSNIKVIENFGTQSYFTCMKFSELMIGNTSSGIIEAASFQKYAINVGNRQNGRLTSDNVINVPFDSELIIDAARKVVGKLYTGRNVYFKAETSSKILRALKKHHGTFS